MSRRAVRDPFIGGRFVAGRGEFAMVDENLKKIAQAVINRALIDATTQGKRESLLNQQADACRFLDSDDFEVWRKAAGYRRISMTEFEMSDEGRRLASAMKAYRAGAMTPAVEETAEYAQAA